MQQPHPEVGARLRKGPDAGPATTSSPASLALCLLAEFSGQLVAPKPPAVVPSPNSQGTLGWGAGILDIPPDLGSPAQTSEAPHLHKNCPPGSLGRRGRVWLACEHPHPQLGGPQGPAGASTNNPALTITAATSLSTSHGPGLAPQGAGPLCTEGARSQAGMGVHGLPQSWDTNPGHLASELELVLNLNIICTLSRLPGSEFRSF